MGDERTEEAEEIQPEDGPILVRWLRGIPGWDQAQLAAAAGIHPSSVSRYEAGKLVPPRGTVERLTRAVGVPVSFVYAVLLPVIGTIRSLSKGQVPQDLEEVLASLVRSLSGAFRAETAALLFDLALKGTRPARPPVALPCAEDLAVAAELFARLEPCNAEDQEFLVENAPEFHHWGLAVRFAEASAATTVHDAGHSLHLARLARRVARLTTLAPAFRPGLEGYLEAFFANALRVKGDLPAAKAAFQRSRQLWKEGGEAWAGLLSDWRLPDLATLEPATGHSGSRRSDR
ncbi:MAG TPA: helix-turn-helix transcriptional regulator [Thermoanaerobaculia bacterium]|nr:helix-turn-helix transcriptional regulator [Thermoanaerobaculia bacterium]